MMAHPRLAGYALVQENRRRTTLARISLSQRKLLHLHRQREVVVIEEKTPNRSDRVAIANEQASFCTAGPGLEANNTLYAPACGRYRCRLGRSYRYRRSYAHDTW